MYSGTDVKHHPSVQARTGAVVLPSPAYLQSASTSPPDEEGGLRQLRELIGELLQKKPKERLGYTAGAAGGVLLVQQHPFLREAQLLKPMWRPTATIVEEHAGEFAPAADKDTGWEPFGEQPHEQPQKDDEHALLALF
jgi:hypothetical protein